MHLDRSASVRPLAPDVVVVGGGLIGLATAWRATQRGLTVTVVDPAPGTGASWAAAGMVAPVSEAFYGEESLLALNIESARRYPGFVAEVEEASGEDAGWRPNGTLAVAFDAGDKAVLDELHRYQTALGLDSQPLTSREVRRLEPMLAPSVRGGLTVPGDHQVDNRALTSAVLVAAERAGVRVVRDRVSEVLVRADRAAGVRCAGGEVVEAGQVLLAAGAWSASIGGLPPEVLPPVRPVKGQILRLRCDPHHPLLGRTVRGVVAGSTVYLVTRANGEIVVGATVEEQGEDTTVTAGGVYQLLRDAHTLVPGLTETTLVESWAGLRPGSPDNRCMLGPTELPGLVLATGHHRNGILLTPVTADLVSEILSTGEVPDAARPFLVSRFARVAA